MVILFKALFRSSHFLFLLFGHFWQRSYKNTKILCNLCLHFVRQDGQDGKKRKENHSTKVTKISKTKIQKYGMNEIFGNNQHTKKLIQMSKYCFLNGQHSYLGQSFAC